MGEVRADKCIRHKDNFHADIRDSTPHWYV